MFLRAPEALCPWSCMSPCAPPAHSGYIVIDASPSRHSFGPLTTDAMLPQARLAQGRDLRLAQHRALEERESQRAILRFDVFERT